MIPKSPRTKISMGDRTIYLEHETFDSLALWWYYRFWRGAFLGGKAWHQPDHPYSYLRGRGIYGDVNTGMVTNIRGSEYTNLQRFDRESVSDYEQRLVRATYANWPALIVRAVVSHLLDDSPVLYGGAETIPGLAEYFANPDGTRRGNLAFLREVAITTQVYGTAWVVTERDGEAGAIRSQVFTPLEVPNWNVGTDGDLDWVILRSIWSPTVRSPLGTDPPVHDLYRIWSRDTVEDWIGPAKDQSAGGYQPLEVALTRLGDPQPNPLGRVPVDVCLNLRRLDVGNNPIGISRIESVAELAREHYNLTSHKRLQLYEQMFPFLAVPGGQKLMGKLVLGVMRAIGFDPRVGGGVPVYVAPPTGPVDTIREEIKDLEAAMKAIAGMSRGFADQSLQPRPNDAANIEAADKASELLAVRGNMQAWDTRRIETVLGWSGYRGQRVTVEYGRPQVAPQIESEPAVETATIPAQEG